MKLPIYAYGHPIYRAEINDLGEQTDEIIKLIRNMKETMWLLKCEALAAVHVGKTYNLFLIDVASKGKKVFFNSEIIEHSGTISSIMETDLSIPNISVGVDRLSNVTLKYQNESFEAVEETFGGKTARAILQMVDLCNGKTMIQRIHPLRQKSLKKYLREIRIGEHLPNYEFIIDNKSPN